MDKLTRQIADFAANLSYEHLPEEVVAAARRFLVDALACGIAAHDCDWARIGRRLAGLGAPERYPGRILVHGERSTAESAAFVNTAMIRNLDFNDQYPGGHPSDCLGDVLRHRRVGRSRRWSVSRRNRDRLRAFCPDQRCYGIAL